MSANSTDHQDVGHQRPGNLAGLTPSECLQLLVEHRQKWLLTTIVCGVLALGYALIMPRYWEASQGFMVRPEVSNSAVSKPGEFADLYQMRTFQETILELAKSQQVITATLQTVEASEEALSLNKIESLRKRLSLLPPGGAEFGKTEVCYLQVKDKNRQRAIELVAELGRQIDARLRRLQKEKQLGLSDELLQQVEQAQAALQIETSRLAEFESQVGADLGELRMLNASYSGQSDLRQQAIKLNEERRSVEMNVRKAKQLLSILRAARQAPEQLIAMPSSLLESQPTLRRLKNGLVDSQLRVARLEGTRTADHPQVQAANKAVQYIRQDLHGELEVAIRGIEVELQLSESRMAQLELQNQGVQQRLLRLASLRADYANRTAAVENSRVVLDQAQKQLGSVNAAEMAAQTASLMTAIDKPETGPNPGGPGRAAVVLVGTFGGFALGMGWLFLTVVPPSQPTDHSVAAAVAAEVVAEPAEQIKPAVVESVVAAPIVSEPVVAEPVETQPVVTAPPMLNGIPNSLPPAVAARIAEIVASREVVAATEVHV